MLFSKMQQSMKHPLSRHICERSCLVFTFGFHLA